MTGVQTCALPILVILTVATVVAGAVNFEQQQKYHLPDDGVTWLDRTVGERQQAVAAFVLPGSPGDKAGIHKDDALVSINGALVENSQQATYILSKLGAWRKAEYRILHGTTEVPASVVIGEAEHDRTLYYQYAVGLVYLCVGLFVYFRRGNAPRAQHFFQIGRAHV